MRLGHIARYLPLLQECPGPRGGLPTLYCPFRHFPHRCIATTVGFVRLACLIHAANVRSEPGSNPSKVFASRGCPRVDEHSEFEVAWQIRLKELATGYCDKVSPLSSSPVCKDVSACPADTPSRLACCVPRCQRTTEIELSLALIGPRWRT